MSDIKRKEEARKAAGSESRPQEAEYPKRIRLEESQEDKDEEELLALLEEMDNAGLPSTALSVVKDSECLQVGTLDKKELFVPPLSTASHRNLLQFLPEPFYSNDLEASSWALNSQWIISSTPDVRWEIRTMLRDVHRMKVGERAPLVLAMVRKVTMLADDVGAILSDESGQACVTINSAAIAANGLRIHFGMTLIVKDSIVFGETDNEETDRHLLISPRNLHRIFSNVHHV